MYTLPAKLTVHDIAAIADGARVGVSDSALATIAEAHRAADRIAQEQEVYGRSTGVGANRLTSTATDPRTHGMNLLRSHAVDAGPAHDPASTRAMLAVRLNQLLHPGSGIEPGVVEALARLLSSGSLPEVRRFGGIGTADLPALAGTALALTGERPVSEQGFEPLPHIAADSALPFMSSSALTIGTSALAAARLDRLVHATLAIFALSAFAARSNRAGYSEHAAEAIGSPTSSRNARTLSTLLDDSTWTPMRIQDPFAYRGFLPSFSVVTVALDRLRECIERLTALAQENPRFFPENGSAVHHGAFLENWLAHELDATAIALGQYVPHSVGRIRFMNDDAVSGLPRFLAPNLGGSSGTMIIEYVAASAMGEIFSSIAPLSTQSAVLSCGVEEDATFATGSVAKLERSLDAYEVMLACELLVSVRAARMRTDDAKASSRVREVLEIASKLPSSVEDRDLRPDLEIAQTLLDDIARVAGFTG